MTSSAIRHAERRDSTRLPVEIPVRYKFLSKVIDLGTDQIFEGQTRDLSASGCKLVGKIPSLNWIPALLMGKIVVGVNLLLPSKDEPVKALCRLTHMEAFEEGAERFSFGLVCEEITKENADEIMRYLIKIQMTGK